jgi:hypothetical protein
VESSIVGGAYDMVGELQIHRFDSRRIPMNITRKVLYICFCTSMFTEYTWMTVIVGPCSVFKWQGQETYPQEKYVYTVTKQ